MKRLTAWKVWWKVLPLLGNGSLGRSTPTSCPQFGILTLKWLFNLWRWLTIYQSEDQSQSSKSSPRQRSSAGIHPDGDLVLDINVNRICIYHPPPQYPCWHPHSTQHPPTPLNTPQHPSPGPGRRLDQFHLGRSCHRWTRDQNWEFDTFCWKSFKYELHYRKSLCFHNFIFVKRGLKILNFNIEGYQCCSKKVYHCGIRSVEFLQADTKACLKSHRATRAEICWDQIFASCVKKNFSTKQSVFLHNTWKYM